MEEQVSRSGANFCGANLPPSVTRSALVLTEKRLGRVALLFLSAHAPVAFLAGHLLYLCAPLSRLALAGHPHERVVDEWAEVFCRPEAMDALAALLITDSATSRS